MSLVVRARRVVLPDGERAAAVHTEDGRITAVTGFDDAPAGRRHPGRRRGAAARPGRQPRARQRARAHRVGGLRLRDAGPRRRRGHHDRRHAPELDPADDDRRGVARETAGGGGPGRASTSPSGAAPCRATSTSCAPLHEAGVVGFKCFLLDSGVPEFPPLDDAGLRAALDRARRLRRAADRARRGRRRHRARRRSPTAPSYAGFLASRPRGGGGDGDRPAGRAPPATPAPGRTSSTWPTPTRCRCCGPARADGVRITVETCPHYLTFAAEEVPDGATAFKCCPPIREAAHREALWAALADGDVDLVVSDHSPCTPELKRLDVGDFGAAWGGIAVAAGGAAGGVDRRPRPRHRPGRRRAAGWPRRRPRLAGLPARAAIAVGKDADLVAFAPEERWTVGDLRAPQPGDALRRAGAARRRPADLAARRAGRRHATGRLLRRGMPE